MSALKQHALELIPLSASQSKFQDPKNKAKISRHLSEMASLSHKISDGKVKELKDPVLANVSVELEQDLKRAEMAFSEGKLEYAQQLTRRSTAYCVRCHTQVQQGAVFGESHLAPVLTDLKPIERAEFYVATRQFPQAFKEIQANLAIQGDTLADQISWEKSIRLAMSLAVRMDDSAQTARALLKQISLSSSTPRFVSQDMKGWNKAVTEWEREQANPSISLTSAKKLISSGQKTQSYSSDRSADIYYLRAQKILQQVIAKDSKLSEQAKADVFFNLGHISENFTDLQFWDVNESYFEQCIRSYPHSPTAKKCFERLERSTLFGYSGSGGLSVPAEVQRKLSTLKSLSFSAQAPK